MKKTLLNILLGASLFFGVKTNAQEYFKYNRDADEFSEEVICWRKDGFNATKQKYKQSEMGLTIINYSDKNNDNFYESIKIFNCDKMRITAIEEFYIDKNTGLIDYKWKNYSINNLIWNNLYSDKSPSEILNLADGPKGYNAGSYKNLTKEQIYNLYPGNWTFYGGFGERTKKLINAGKDETKLKEMVNNERYLWEMSYK